MRDEILNQVATPPKKKIIEATAEQRLQYNEVMSCGTRLPPTGAHNFLSFSFLVQLFKESRRELTRMKLWGFPAMVTHFPPTSQVTKCP